jgi:hypothetical protein
VVTVTCLTHTYNISYTHVFHKFRYNKHMSFNLDNFSIVVLAQAHNPSILNPDFLKNQGIIEPSFTPTNVICTPPVAQVSYREGITIMAEFEKVQFIDADPKRIPFESPIPSIALNYIKALPHVRYTAAGINFVGHYLCKDKATATALLPAKFLKDGKWSSFGDTAPSVGVKFTYLIGNIRCTINLDTTDAIRPNEPPVPVIMISANYHVDSTNIGEISTVINEWKNQYKHFSDIVLYALPEGD